jgi:4-hydroxymandelate oxidase
VARRRTLEIRTLGELEAAAAALLPEAIRGYVNGGAAEEVTLRENHAAFGRWTLRPRVLEEVRTLDLATKMLGAEVRAPFFIAPTAYQRAVHPDGERGMARAASHVGILAVFSTLSSDSLEAIARAAPSGPRWFQVYLQPKFVDSQALAERAERAGYSALVVTVDTPVLGSRDQQLASGFAMENPVALGNGRNVVSPPRPPGGPGPRFPLEGGSEASWELLRRLRETTTLPLVVKGLLRAEDAQRAVEVGASAVIVSNHGGRQLDRSPASLDALPEIVEAVGDRVEVYVDGGVRRGSDVLVALALGARAVGLGRPPLWALAVDGEAGVGRFLGLLSSELATSLAILGRRSVQEVDRTDVRPAPLGRSTS